MITDKQEWEDAFKSQDEWISEFPEPFKSDLKRLIERIKSNFEKHKK